MVGVSKKTEVSESASSNSPPPELFVLTRLAESLPNKSANIASSEWIENQCRFVENHSRPSLEGQSDSNFVWLVSVSDKLSPPFIERVQRAINPLGTLVFQKGNEHSSETFARYLASRPAGYLTVRFDSDDVLHPLFVQLAKQNWDDGKEVYSFFSGVVYDLDRQIAGLWPHSSNTFLFHKGYRGSNVYGLGNHSRAERDHGGKLKVIRTNHPMWIKLTHSHNGWGDSITHADRPVFGSFVQAHFTSGEFPTTFVPVRDFPRLIGFVLSRLRKFLSLRAR